LQGHSLTWVEAGRRNCFQIPKRAQLPGAFLLEEVHRSHRDAEKLDGFLSAAPSATNWKNRVEWLRRSSGVIHTGDLRRRNISYGSREKNVGRRPMLPVDSQHSVKTTRRINRDPFQVRPAKGQKLRPEVRDLPVPVPTSAGTHKGGSEGSGSLSFLSGWPGSGITGASKPFDCLKCGPGLAPSPTFANSDLFCS
jgi:hypothetical protein